MEVKKKRPQAGSRYWQASFTIEAAILVPLILAVLFLLLQVILFLHDTVVSEAWLYQETWKLRWNEEQEEMAFAAEEAPALAVLRHSGTQTAREGNTIRQEAQFTVRLLPEFVTVLLAGQPQQTEKQAVEQKRNPWQFIRIAGAIMEEWEEQTK